MTLSSQKSINNYFLWFYRRFRELVIYSSVWVAMAIASLGLYVDRILELGADWQPIALIFFTALIPYNLDRIFDSYVQQIPDSREQLFFRQPFVWLVLLVAIAGTVYLLYTAPVAVRYASIAGVIPLLYGTPIFPWKREQWQWYRLKDIPGAKAWIVGAVLTYAAVALPFAYTGAKFDYAAVVTTLFLFVFIVTNSHTFDFRDLESDRQKGVITLPIAIGVRGAKILLAVMNLAALLLIFFAWQDNILAYRPEMAIALGVNLIYVYLVRETSPRWIYGILIEGCLFIPLLGYWII